MLFCGRVNESFAQKESEHMVYREDIQGLSAEDMAQFGTYRIPETWEESVSTKSWLGRLSAVYRHSIGGHKGFSKSRISCGATATGGKSSGKRAADHKESSNKKRRKMESSEVNSVDIPRRHTSSFTGINKLPSVNRDHTRKSTLGKLLNKRKIHQLEDTVGHCDSIPPLKVQLLSKSPNSHLKTHSRIPRKVVRDLKPRHNCIVPEKKPVMLESKVAVKTSTPTKGTKTADIKEVKAWKEYEKQFLEQQHRNIFSTEKLMDKNNLPQLLRTKLKLENYKRNVIVENINRDHCYSKVVKQNRKRLCSLIPVKTSNIAGTGSQDRNSCSIGGEVVTSEDCDRTWSDECSALDSTLDSCDTTLVLKEELLADSSHSTLDEQDSPCLVIEESVQAFPATPTAGNNISQI